MSIAKPMWASILILISALAGCSAPRLNQALEKAPAESPAPPSFDYLALSRKAAPVFVTFTVHRDTQEIRLDQVSSSFNFVAFFNREESLYFSPSRLSLGCLRMTSANNYSLCFPEDKVSGKRGTGRQENIPHYRSIYHAHHKWDYSLIPKIGEKVNALMYKGFQSDVAAYRSSIQGADIESGLKASFAIASVWPGFSEWRESVRLLMNRCLASCSGKDGASVIALANRAPSGAVDSGVLRLLTLKHGEFVQVYALARAGDDDALRRAFDIASTDQEKRSVDIALVNKVKEKLFVVRAKMRGTGQTKSSDTDVWIARRIESEITSEVEYEATLNSQVMRQGFNYRLNGKVVIEVRGKVNGERNCGLLWMGRCKIENEDATRVYEEPIVIDLHRSTGYRTSGVSKIRWKSTSGGSGMSSGLLMGGAQLFVATGVSMRIVVDAVESL